eukprot:TRINITY_DN13104_c0_g2_i1.p1 TRINITY_DN13104_c0_g2~~TRINITY_DN13104_c0_g2_i1.p1  ORF type:complete len:598 (+),score=102.53 TRINITY_DN13104_c0_g2_i1:23-1795(+)
MRTLAVLVTILSAVSTQVVDHSRHKMVSPGERSGGAVVNLTKNVFGFDDPIVWEPEGGLVSYHYDDIEFEITSDKTKTMEVVLFVANHWEDRVWVSIRSSNNENEKTDPHVLAEGCCFDFTDECRQQTSFQYALPPLIQKHSKFQERIALRVQRFPSTASLVGKWTIRVTNKLPDRIDNANVKLVVFQKTYGSWEIIVVVMLVAFATVAALVVLWDYLKNKMAQTRIIRPGEDTRGNVPVSRRIGELYTKVKETIMSIRASLAGRYSEMRDEQGTTESQEMEEDGEDDDEKTCRICRCTQPEGDLFCPCACRGSVRWVHRECLEEWRSKTTNEENKIKCSECKAPFTIAITHTNKRFDFARAALRTGGVAVLQLALIETILITVGYLYKITIGLLTAEIDRINWNINLYHHMVAGTVIVAYQFHAMLLGGFLSGLIPDRLWGVRVVILYVSLLFEVIVGYFGHFLLWTMNSTVWEWQVHYCTGFALIFLYTLFIHDSIVHAYQKWKTRYVVERVIEPPEAPADVEAPEVRSSPATTPTSPGPAPASGPAQAPFLPPLAQTPFAVGAPRIPEPETATTTTSTTTPPEEGQN